MYMQYLSMNMDVQMQYLTMNKALGPRRAAILSLVALYDPVEPFIIKYAPAVASNMLIAAVTHSQSAHQEVLQQHSERYKERACRKSMYLTCTCILPCAAVHLVSGHSVEKIIGAC